MLKTIYYLKIEFCFRFLYFLKIYLKFQKLRF